ncbi:hypothetical protein K1I73_11680, partial [Streptococcus gordonii]|nr:hypothetical protein [Streptococcus gordonii]
MTRAETKIYPSAKTPTIIRLSFLLYPFTFLAMADLLCILPSLFLLNDSLRLFKILRMLRTLRIFKFFRYSKNIQILT